MLLGHHERDDTTRAPQSVSDARQHWITRYLNSRFRQFPDGIEGLVREHHDRGKPERLTRVDGERTHVERRAVCGGIVELSDAVACWWVLDEDHRARRREAGTWTSSGHIVAVTGDELYDLLAQTRGGYGRLQDFGVRFGYERVVIHLEPQIEPHRLQASTARTMLLLDHEPLLWARWGEEFAAAMPEEIRQLQERAANADGVPRQDAIRGRISAIMPLYQLSRYRPTQPPRQPSAESPGISTGDEPTGRPTTRPQTHSTPPTAESPHTPAYGDPAHNGSDGEPPADDPDTHADAQSGAVDLPDVAWVSARDRSRAPGDLEDQSARYHPGRHELTINADFRAITDLITHWQDRYKGIPGARAVIEAHVREWCEQILVEVVLALLPRHLLHATLQKRLAQRLGAPQPWRVGGARRRPMRCRESEQATHEPASMGRDGPVRPLDSLGTAPRSAAAHFPSTHPRHATAPFRPAHPGAKRRLSSRRMRSSACSS